MRATCLALLAILAVLYPSESHAETDPYNVNNRATYGEYRCWENNVVKQANAYVVGDSITYRGTSALKRLRPGWYVEGVPGRRASCLDEQVQDLLDVDATPRAVVFALGTNASQPVDYYNVYRDAAAMLPASTKVLLVTPYRDPKYNTLPGVSEAGKAYHQYHYARAMIGLAAERPNTCVVPWRSTAQRHPEYMNDGVHPNTRGIPVWAKMLSESIWRCER